MNVCADRNIFFLLNITDLVLSLSGQGCQQKSSMHTKSCKHILVYLQSRLIPTALWSRLWHNGCHKHVTCLQMWLLEGLRNTSIRVPFRLNGYISSDKPLAILFIHTFINTLPILWFSQTYVNQFCDLY